LHNNRRNYLRYLAVATLLFGLASLSFATDPAITWLKLTPSTSPSPRAAMAMAYDGVSKKVILFGGYDATSYLN
jgi:hypothetical protein